MLEYFPRYHTKENQVTANTILLLRNMYSYSPAKFYSFLSMILDEETENISLNFRMQYPGKGSIPDAAIFQESFKTIIETKLNSNFNEKQLFEHVNSFSSETTQVLLTLDPKPLDSIIYDSIMGLAKDKDFRHIHLTFDELIHLCKKTFDKSKDFDILEIIEDYELYCTHENLVDNSWKRMKARLTGKSYKINHKYNLYYDVKPGQVNDWKYLGLYYNHKAIRAIGEVKTVIEVSFKRNDYIEFKRPIKGKLSSQMKQRITNCIEELDYFEVDYAQKLYFFMVEDFVLTEFVKITSLAMFGAKIFNLDDYIESLSKSMTIHEIAEKLKEHTW